MIEIAGRLVNPEHVVSAELEHRHYMNGSATYLVVKLTGGEVIRREHGFGFDAFAAYDKLKGV